MIGKCFLKVSAFGSRAIGYDSKAASALETLCRHRVPRHSIYVVDTESKLVYPTRRMVELQGDEVVTSGKLENFEQGFPTILVNDQPAMVDSDFNFSATIPVEVGLNALNIEVREPTLSNPPSLYTQFLAAYEYRPNTDGRLRVDDAIVIDLHEALLDSDLRVVIEPAQP